MENKPQAKPFPWFIALLPPLLVMGAYWPAFQCDFVAWDDLGFIVHNPHLKVFDLRWMCTTFQTGNWIPLTRFSFYLNYFINGLNPGMWHLTNLLLHAANTVLVFLFSRRILLLASSQPGPLDRADKTVPIVPTAFLASLLFGLHPIHVESVAWVSEKKDVLSGFFFISGLLVYLPDPSRPLPDYKRLGLCLGFFILALLSKPMVVTFPLVLCLLDFWPLRKFFPLKKTILDKVPFFIFSLAAGIISILAQSKESGIVTIEATPFYLRVINAFHSIAFYLWKMALPMDLSPYYPMVPPRQIGFVTGAVVGVFILAGTGWLCFWLRKRKPFLAVVWLYTIITLLPILGFIQVGYQAAADRYTYLPSIALFILVAAWAAWFLSAKPFLLIVFSTLFTGGLIYGTVNQLAVWKDSISLWEDVVRLYPDYSPLPLVNLARAYNDAGRLGDALEEYDRALTIFPPGSPQIHQEKGKVLINLGRPDDAILEFKTAISLDPGGDAALDSHRSLWMAYERKGMHGDALSEVQEAMKLDSNSAENNFYLGITFWEIKDLKNAEEAFKRAYLLEPDNPEYLDTLASLYQKSGRSGDALDLYQKGTELQPIQIEFFIKLADLEMLQGLYLKAVEVLQRAETLQPQNQEIKDKLAIALVKANRNPL